MEVAAYAGVIASLWVLANIVGTMYHNYKIREYERRQAEAQEEMLRRKE